MIDVLNHIDDVKKIRSMIVGGNYDQAVKQCDVSIAHNEKKVEDFEKWADAEAQKDAYLRGTVVSESADSPLLAHPGDFSGDKSE